MQKFDSVSYQLPSAVGAGASFTVPYPYGRSSDDYLGGTDHYIVSHSARTLFARSNDFTVTFGASNITVTMGGAIALAAGTVVYLNIDRAESENNDNLTNADRMSVMAPARLMFGVPTAAAANDIVLSQACTAANGLATGINGARATAGVASVNTPRNVVAAWTGAAVLTITGEDEYGKVMRESSASGTSFTGKKAFKKITKVQTSADITGLTVGTGVILGLPVFLADVPDVIREMVNGAIPGTAGTILAGDNSAATATTGDVRGTYTPNQAPDGSRFYELTALVRSTTHRGVAQF